MLSSIYFYSYFVVNIVILTKHILTLLYRIYNININSSNSNIIIIIVVVIVVINTHLISCNTKRIFFIGLDMESVK